VSNSFDDPFEEARQQRKPLRTKVPVAMSAVWARATAWEEGGVTGNVGEQKRATIDSRMTVRRHVLILSE
jgi:hypothetical protein